MSIKHKKFLYIIIVSACTNSFFTSATHSYGQKIQAEVSVNLEQLYQDKQFVLQDFQNTIKQYFEFTTWPEGKYPYEIFMKIQIVIDRVQSSFEDVHRARLFIASDATGFKAVDRRWRFPFKQNQTLQFNPILFEPLTGLLNFYTFISIGEYLDRLELFAGDTFFQKAFESSLLGQADRYNFWWDKREELIRTYLKDSHKTFRAMTAAFDAALYWHADNNEEEKIFAANETIKMLEEAAKDIGEEKFMTDFFEREYSKLATLFTYDESHLRTLARLDPVREDFYLNYNK